MSAIAGQRTHAERDAREDARRELSDGACSPNVPRGYDVIGALLAAVERARGGRAAGMQDLTPPVVRGTARSACPELFLTGHRPAVVPGMR